MRYMKYIIIIYTITFMSLTSSYGQTMGTYVNTYFNDLESKGASVFVARCEETGDYTATMLFKTGTKDGLLIEEKDNSVVNIANISLSTSGLKIGETNGGIYSMERVKKLVGELSKHNFILISPFNRRELANYRPGIACRNAPLK